MSSGITRYGGTMAFLPSAPAALNPGEIGIGNVGGALVQVNADGSTTSIGGGSGLNQLTGDVTAGPGTGSQAATLANIPLAAMQTISGKMNENLDTGASALTDFALAPTGWTLNGDTDGGYEIVGEIVLPAASAAFSYFFQPTANSSNQRGYVIIATGSGAPTSAALTTLFIGSGTTNAGRLTFRIKFEAKTGHLARQYQCISQSFDPTAVATTIRVSSGEWNDTSTVVDATTRIHCDNTNGIGAHSMIKVIRTLMAA